MYVIYDGDYIEIWFCVYIVLEICVLILRM